MDRYQVELSACAEQNIREIHDYIGKHGPADPIQWSNGLAKKLGGLERFPEGCALAPENEYRPQTLRQTLYGPFRLIFEVRGDRVYILTVRHGARRFLTKRELERFE